MRIPLRAALALAALATAALAADERSPSKPDRRELPGAFQTLRVTPPRADHYFCPVCETGLHPGVLVFFREAEGPGRPVGELLKRIDAVLEKHPGAEMTAAGVQLNDGGYRAALESKPLALDAAINAKDNEAARLRDLAKAEGLKHIILGLGVDPADQKKYGLNADAYADVLVFNRLQVVASYPFAQAEQLTSAEIDKIAQAVEALADRTEKAHPKRK